jgi:hypothetical protein
VLQKNAAGESLDQYQMDIFQKGGLHNLAMLMDDSRFNLDIFAIKTGSAIKVVLTLKNQELMVGPAPIFDIYGNKTQNSPKNLDALNNLTYKLDFYFIVVQNRNKVTSEEVFKNLHDKLFVEGISYFMPSFIVLETIQYQLVYPKKNKNNLVQKSYGTCGRFNSRSEVSIKPFIGASAKNAHKLSIPCVSSKFKDPVFLATESQQLQPVLNNLTQRIIIGPAAELALHLAVKTSKQEAVAPYLPVKSASIGGFAASSRSQHGQLSTLGQAPDRNNFSSGVIDAETTYDEP